MTGYREGREEQACRYEISLRTASPPTVLLLVHPNDVSSDTSSDDFTNIFILRCTTVAVEGGAV